ncbi:hypothetical protein [Pseudomonas sp.]|uniref:hypothetical protein n=1 Tax=Pseudomonas sp. TaxID=306 RepID=UPI002617B371|nr:hypothetical protein [Pseudomonas sp.]
MAELQQPAIKPELYERLINRLGLALDVARTAVKLRNEAPAELELRGLSPAEFELIEAYLDKGALDFRADAFGFKVDNVIKDSSVAQVIDGSIAVPKHLAKVIWLDDHQRSKASARGKSLFFR